MKNYSYFRTKRRILRQLSNPENRMAEFGSPVGSNGEKKIDNSDSTPVHPTTRQEFTFLMIYLA
jgi:hypothetical protein